MILRLVLTIVMVLATAGRARAQAGSLSPLFGTEGRTVTSVPPTINNRLFAMAAAPDGTMIAVGSGDEMEAGGASSALVVARVSIDGQMIASTGLHLAPGDWVSSQDVAKGVAIQPDGRIVIAADTCTINFCGERDLAVIRLLPSLARDASFGDGAWGSGVSIVTVRDPNWGVTGIAVQPDGRIVVAGTSGLLRLTHDGHPDPSFGTSGRVAPVFPAFEEMSALALTPRARIIVAGATYDTASAMVSLAQYRSDGSLDTAFGAEGRATVPGIVGRALAVAIQPDGRIVVAGEIHTGATRQLGLWRFNADGSLESGFGDGGSATIGGLGMLTAATAVAIQTDDRIVIAGQTMRQGADGGESNDFLVARFLADGTPDISFGRAGAATTDLLGYQDIAEVVVIQPSGTIVLGGWSLDADFEARFAFAAYLGWPPNEAPVIVSLTASPNLLWPPNHKMVNVTVEYGVIDDFDASPECHLSVPDDTSSDWEIVDAHHVRLRAARADRGRARIYAIRTTCQDTGGRETQQQVLVRVERK